MNTNPSSHSDLFPDLEEDPTSAAAMEGEPLSTEEATNQKHADSGNSTSKALAAPTTKQILLKYQCMPLYPTTEESREQLDSSIERYQSQTGINCLPDTEYNNTIREHAVILHSLFSKFCTPPPSAASIYNIVLLESRRVAALRGGGLNESIFLDIPSGSNDLPKEPLVHTSASSAQFVIAILKSPSKGCLLELPLEFRLSFFRVLVRLLSEELDEEYDQECLFDWSFLDHDNKPTSGVEMGNNTETDGESKKDIISDHEIDGSYHVVRRRASYSSDHESKPEATKSSFRKSVSNADIITQAWNYGSWKKKKSSPLYSTIRFCSNAAWENNVSCVKSSSTLSQRRRWDYVADNVKLDEEEEKELNNEKLFEGGDRGVSASVELVRALLKIYQSILDQDNASMKGQYLLLGPVAHFLGLVISATGSSVKDLRNLLVIAEGSDPTKGYTRQNSRRISLTSVKDAPQHILPHLGRLHIIRMLRYAAEYSTQSIGILDKVGPKAFFSFGDCGKGLSTTLANKPWPFKHDFAMACWFRAETFVRASFRSGSGDNRQGTVLFRARTQDGGQIEISFESCSGSDDNLFATAATLLVTVADAHDPNDHKIPRKIRLVGCVLSPSVWYHVAVRMTKSKPSPFTLNFNKTNELSIFLNGKLMLRTNLKLPRFPDHSSSGIGGSLASVGLGPFGRQVANGSKGNQPIELTFFSNFDGQAGALYIFNELVSDETIQSLYRTTAGKSDQGSWFTFSDGWDTSRSKLCHISKALSSASMQSELEDIVLPDYPILIGEVSREREVLIDVKDDDGALPSAQGTLSRASFGSKLFMVWDPSRVNGTTVVDLHSGIDVMLEKDVSLWSFENIKDTLMSLGGTKRLIPLFSVLKAVPTMNCPEREDVVLGINQDFPNLFISSMLFLIASFCRGHVNNSRELYRCGAVNIIHKILHDCKRRELESYHGAYYGMGSSLQVAKYNVSALLDLWQSSRRVFGLEMAVFSQLLFNIGLLLGGASSCDGVYFHAVLLPVLSEITRQNPDKVRDSVGTAQFFDCVREYSMFDQDASDEPTPLLAFDRSKQSSRDMPDHLTVFERRLVVDFLFGMVVTMLARNCPVNDLSPLVTFLTGSLDHQWQQDDQNAKNIPAAKSTVNDDTKTALRCEKCCRYLATLKAANVLFFLLQKSPSIPHLIESLTSLLESGNSVASWMLCCLVNQYDDALRAIGIKCLVAYLHATLDFTPGGHDGSTVKLSNAVKYGLGVISSSSNVLAALLAGRGNVKVIYKLLWHLLKCHRERLGEDTYNGLMYLLVDNESALTLVDMIVPNKNSYGGFLLDIERFNSAQSSINVAATLSRQRIRNVYGVSTVFRLLRFMKNEQKERCLFDCLALVLASPSSVAVVLSCDDWQSCLFQLVAGKSIKVLHRFLCIFRSKN